MQESSDDSNLQAFMAEHQDILRGDLKINGRYAIDSQIVTVMQDFNVYEQKQNYKLEYAKFSRDIYNLQPDDQNFVNWLQAHEFVIIERAMEESDTAVHYDVSPISPLYTDVVRTLFILNTIHGDIGIQSFTNDDVFYYAIGRTLLPKLTYDAEKTPLENAAVAIKLFKEFTEFVKSFYKGPNMRAAIRHHQNYQKSGIKLIEVPAFKALLV